MFDYSIKHLLAANVSTKTVKILRLRTTWSSLNSIAYWRRPPICRTHSILTTATRSRSRLVSLWSGSLSYRFASFFNVFLLRMKNVKIVFNSLSKWVLFHLGDKLSLTTADQAISIQYSCSQMNRKTIGQ